MSREELARLSYPPTVGIPRFFTIDQYGHVHARPESPENGRLVIALSRMFSFDPPTSRYSNRYEDAGVLQEADIERLLDQVRLRTDEFAYRAMTNNTFAAPQPTTLTAEMIAESVRELLARQAANRTATHFPNAGPYEYREDNMGMTFGGPAPQRGPPTAFFDAYISIGLAESFRQTQVVIGAQAFAHETYRLSRIDPETAAAARARATGLLKSLLRTEQWAEFERTRTFTERIGEDEFVVTPGGMIGRKRDGALVERWCVNPDPYANGNEFMPVEDMAIGQLLHLRAGPEKVKAAANVFPVRDRGRLPRWLTL